jgi:hypothetical protein
MNIKLLSLFVSIHLLAIAFFVYMDLNIVILNFELAFFASLLVLFSSYQGYKKMINYSVENDAILDIKDPLDKIEDPYDLYDEQEEGSEPLDQKELKKRLKKDGLKKMVKTAAGHTSWKRIAAYIVLVAIFMGLNNNAVLHVGSFLTGLTLGLITAAFIGPKLIEPQTK